MDEVKKNIDAILNQFAAENLNQTLKDFTLIGLKSVIMAELNKIVFAQPKKQEKEDGTDHPK